MHIFHRIIIFLLLVAMLCLSASCQTGRVKPQNPPLLDEVDRILVVPPVLLPDVLPFKSPDHLFKKNMLIGHVDFDEGRTFIDDLNPLMREPVNRSDLAIHPWYQFSEYSNVVVTDFDEYRKIAGSIVIDAVTNVLTEKGYRPFMPPLDPLVDIPYFPVICEDVTGSRYIRFEDDGNFAMSSTRYRVEPLAIEQQRALMGYQYILFTWIESFYTNESGEFYGKIESADPGAFAGLVVCLFDVEKNRPLFVKTDSKNTYQITNDILPSSYLNPENKIPFLKQSVNRAAISCLDALEKRQNKPVPHHPDLSQDVYFSDTATSD